MSGEKLEKAVDQLKEYFIRRLNAGIPLTVEEWENLSLGNQDVWEEVFQEFKLKSLALQAHYIADTLAGGTLAVETVWDILPENVQDEYLKKWGKQNANSKQ